jgi:CheY-like chemotaxis protein
MNPEDSGPSVARVLVVDDDPAMRELCAINLKLAGIAVLEAADGKRALALARAERPDLVVTDVKMPELGGFELAEALARSRRTRRIPLIFVSGEGVVRGASARSPTSRSRSTR